MPNQKVLIDQNGYIVLSFTATGKLEILSWILSFGEHAEILSPPELRQELKQQIRTMRDMYRNKDKKESKKHKQKG